MTGSTFVKNKIKYNIQIPKRAHTVEITNGEQKLRTWVTEERLPREQRRHKNIST